MTKKILSIVAHPELEKGRLNQTLLTIASGFSNVTVHSLYEHYPDYKIDVAKEQALLLAHDVILFQFPFYWYSSPALLKQWMDQVLTYGFAFSSKGSKLKGKTWAMAITAGTSFEEYGASGANMYTLHELLRPFELTARYCDMTYEHPYTFHGFKNADGSHPSDAELLSKAGNFKNYLEQLSR